MSDNLKRYRAIRTALKELYPQEPQGNLARHLNTLAALISGIVGSRRTNLPHIAAKIPLTAKKESRTKRFARWIANDKITAELYFLPFAAALLAHIPTQPLLLVMDGSEVGRHCLTLMISVVYKQRALPLAWIVVTGSKGHFPVAAHLELLAQVRSIIPVAREVIFLGDGEFDSVALQTTLTEYHWGYVCRTAANTCMCEAETWFSFADLALQPGDCVDIPQVRFTIQAYGPVMVIAWWKSGCQQPLYLVTNLELAAEARHWYAKRFSIETFFSDQKSRGFNLHKSHISDPARLARLMIAACLAYIWIVYLGVLAHRDRWVAVIHRPDRCDLSLFRLGLELLEHFLNEDLPIPVAFQIPPLSKSVR